MLSGNWLKQSKLLYEVERAAWGSTGETSSTVSTFEYAPIVDVNPTQTSIRYVNSQVRVVPVNADSMMQYARGEQRVAILPR